MKYIKTLNENINEYQLNFIPCVVIPKYTADEDFEIVGYKNNIFTFVTNMTDYDDVDYITKRDEDEVGEGTTDVYFVDIVFTKVNDLDFREQMSMYKDDITDPLVKKILNDIKSKIPNLGPEYKCSDTYSWNGQSGPIAGGLELHNSKIYALWVGGD